MAKSKLSLDEMISQMSIRPTEYVKTGILAFDLLFEGKGLPLGGLHILHSPSGYGKSTLTLSLARSLADNGHKTLFCMSEPSVKLAEDMGLTSPEYSDKVKLLQLTVYEELENLFRAFVESDYTLMALDSLTAMSISAVMDGETETFNQQPASNARVKAELLKFMQSNLAKHNNKAVICINQQRANFNGGWNSPATVMSGGHCFPAGTLVATSTGFVPIEKIQVGDKVKTPYGYKAVTHVYTRESSLVRYKTSMGKVITTTDNHRFAIANDYDIDFRVPQPGDWVEGITGHFGTVNDSKAYAYGVLVGDGWICRTSNAVGWICRNDELTKKLESDISSFGYHVYKTVDDRGNVPLHRFIITSKELKQDLLSKGFRQTAPMKRIPDYVWSLDRASCAEFLSGLFDSDGCITLSIGSRTPSAQITFTTASERLALDVQLMLQQFGITSTISGKPTKGHYINGYWCKDTYAYSVNLTGKYSYEIFQREIGFKTPLKKQRLLEYCTGDFSIQYSRDFVPGFKNYILGVKRDDSYFSYWIRNKTSLRSFLSGKVDKKTSREITRSQMERLLPYPSVGQDEEVKRRWDNMYYQVNSVEFIDSPETVYDLTVEDVSEYNAEGIRVHNSDRFYSSTVIELRGDAQVPDLVSDSKAIIGKSGYLICPEKNRFASPKVGCPITIFYGQGVSNVQFLIDFLKWRGLITQGGANFKIDFAGQEHSCRGRVGLNEWVKSNIEALTEFYYSNSAEYFDALRKGYR